MLPSIVLSALSIGVPPRIARASFLEVLEQQYVMAARAKGLAEWIVIGKHALRNAGVTIVTVLGIQFGNLVGGAVLTESIFDWPGVGRYAVRAIETTDFPAIMSSPSRSRFSTRSSTSRGIEEHAPTTRSTRA